MLKGVLTATTDFNIAINSQRFHGTKTIYMGDPAGLDPNLGFTVAGPLVPSYECMAADIDGTEEQFNMLYTMQLQSLPAAEFFAVILAALFNGKSLVLYFPSEAKGLKYINFILNYIVSNFGIVPSTENTKYSYNETYNSSNMKLMFNFDLVTPQDVILYSNTLDEFTINRLIVALSPRLNNYNDINEKMSFLSSYKKSLLDAGKVLIRPLQYDNEMVRRE